MDQPSFSFIPEEDVDDFMNTPSTSTDTPPPPRPLPAARPFEETISSLPPPTTFQQPDVHPVHPPQQRPHRIRMESSQEQLEMVTRLFEDHNDTLKVSEISTQTRLSKPTVSRLLKRLRRGEDITKKRKRGRKPKYTPALLKALSTKLCFEQMSIRETQQALAERNMEGVASEALPIVSAATIQRYVTNASLMDKKELVHLSFANVQSEDHVQTPNRTKISKLRR